MLKSSILTGLELLPSKKKNAAITSDSSSTPAVSPPTTAGAKTSTVGTSSASDDIASLRNELFQLRSENSGQSDNSGKIEPASPVIKPANQVKTGNLIMTTDSSEIGASLNGLVYDPKTGRSVPADHPTIPVTPLTNPAQGIPDEYADLAEVVATLPDNFDLTDWDSKTTVQQRKAMAFSGLSAEEQMILLSADISIETIATIQDIQRNRAAYGLTQANADSVSKELIQIANERAGAKNREIPFASDRQRSLFLLDLDKKEQNLLESISGQKRGGSGKLHTEAILLDSENSGQTSEIQIIDNVDSESKLGKAVKTILKGFLNVFYLVPADFMMGSMEALGDLIDQGTISVGVSGSAIAIGGTSGNAGLVMDSDGDVGVIYAAGGFGGTPSASAVGFVSVSSAKDIEDLREFAFEAGGSFSEVICLGGEICTFNDADGNPKAAVNLLAGISPPGPLPVEGHAGTTYSWVKPLFNIYDAWSNFLEEFNEW